MWSGNGIDKDVMDDLKEKLFGERDAVEYIKENGADDYNNFGKDSPNEEMKDTSFPQRIRRTVRRRAPAKSAEKRRRKISPQALTRTHGTAES